MGPSISEGPQGSCEARFLSRQTQGSCEARFLSRQTQGSCEARFLSRQTQGSCEARFLWAREFYERVHSEMAKLLCLQSELNYI
jgi:hypothetical protein